MLFTLFFIPPAPSSLAYISSLYLWVFFWSVCSCSDFTYQWNDLMFVYLCLISLSIKPPCPCMLLPVSGFPSFPWLKNTPLYTFITFFKIHWSIDGHLGCFHVLSIVNAAVLDVGVQVSFQMSVFIFFGQVPQSGIVGLYRSSVSNLRMFWMQYFIIPWTVHVDSHFPAPSPILIIGYLFVNCHTDRCEVTFHRGIDLHFPDDEGFEHIFMCLLITLMSTSETCLFRSSTHVLVRFFMFLMWNHMHFVIYLGY